MTACKETPRDLRKKNKRVIKSRDNLKQKNGQKAAENKKLRGTNKEVKESRDRWKGLYKDEAKENERLVAEIEQHVKQIKGP